MMTASANVMSRGPERLQIPEVQSPGFFCGPLRCSGFGVAHEHVGASPAHHGHQPGIPSRPSRASDGRPCGEACAGGIPGCRLMGAPAEGATQPVIAESSSPLAGLELRSGHIAPMDEHIAAFVVRNYESRVLLGIEELDRASSHGIPLGGSTITTLRPCELWPRARPAWVAEGHRRVVFKPATRDRSV